MIQKMKISDAHKITKNRRGQQPGSVFLHERIKAAEQPMVPGALFFYMEVKSSNNASVILEAKTAVLEAG